MPHIPGLPDGSYEPPQPEPEQPATPQHTEESFNETMGGGGHPTAGSGEESSGGDTDGGDTDGSDGGGSEPGIFDLPPAEFAATAAEEPDTGAFDGAPESLIPDPDGRSDEEIEQILTDIESLQSGDDDEQVQAVFSLAENLQPEQIGELTEQLGIDDQPIVQLATDTEAIGAVATLVDDDASDGDRIAAAITLAESAGDLTTGSLEKALEAPLASVSSGQELIEAIETFQDPEATALDRTEAALEFATAAQESIGGVFPGLGHELRRLDTLGNSISAALTIADPDASVAERAAAVGELFANVPEVKDDLGQLKARVVDGILGKHVDLSTLTAAGADTPAYWPTQTASDGVAFIPNADGSPITDADIARSNEVRAYGAEELQRVADQTGLPVETVTEAHANLYHGVNDVAIGPNQVTTGHFTPDAAVDSYWQQALDGTLDPDSSEGRHFTGVVRHEVIEGRLLDQGIPFNSADPAAWELADDGTYTYKVVPEGVGAHYLSSSQGSDPFSHYNTLGLDASEIPALEADLSNIDEVADAVVANAPGRLRLTDEVLQKLDPDVADALTNEQVDRITSLNDELAVDGSDNIVVDILSKTEDPASVDALLDAVDAQADSAGKKALIETLGELQPGALDDLLASSVDGRNGAIALGETIAKLDSEGQAALAKTISAFDADAINVLVRIGDQVDPAVLQEFLKVADDIPSRQLGQALNFLDSALIKAGVELTPEIGGKILKGVSKLLPVAGAAAAGYDAYQLGAIAADTSLPPDIRFLALTGAKLNAADVVSSLAEPLTGWAGVPIALDIGIGAGALVADLIVTDQIAKYEEALAAGEDYTAPSWLTTLNVAAAGAEGPAGWAQYWGIYGGEAGIEGLSIAAKEGGTAAIHAAEGLLTVGAEGIGEGLELTAEGLHLLADIVRNPEAYGDAAVELGQAAVQKLGELADGAGELARAAADELEGLVGDLKALGEDGLEALTWIATNPAEAATLAVEAIGDVASEALELGTAAGRAAAREALETLEDLAALGGEVAAAVDAAFNSVANKAVELGEQGIEFLGWIANNPGEAAEMAKQTLVDVASGAGELAQAAYGEIVDLGEDGIELAKDVANRLVDLGEDGIEMLGFIANNPGEAAEIAIDGLKNLASSVGAAAERAGEELVSLADAGVEAAKDVVQTLLLEGGEAFVNVVTALGENVGPGMVEVLNGLADLGDAGKDALGRLAGAGFNFTIGGLEAAAGAVSDAGGWLWNNTVGRIR